MKCWRTAWSSMISRVKYNLPLKTCAKPHTHLAFAQTIYLLCIASRIGINCTNGHWTDLKNSSIFVPHGLHT